MNFICLPAPFFSNICLSYNSRTANNDYRFMLQGTKRKRLNKNKTLLISSQQAGSAPNVNNLCARKERPLFDLHKGLESRKLSRKRTTTYLCSHRSRQHNKHPPIFSQRFGGHRRKIARADVLAHPQREKQNTSVEK